RNSCCKVRGRVAVLLSSYTYRIPGCSIPLKNLPCVGRKIQNTKTSSSVDGIHIRRTIRKGSTQQRKTFTDVCLKLTNILPKQIRCLRVRRLGFIPGSVKRWRKSHYLILLRNIAYCETC